jgi:hypothetical protein
MKISTVGAIAAIGLFSAINAIADVTFDTTGSWNGSSSISPFGQPNTTTYGQTFVAPSDNVLENFTFYLEASSSVHLQIQAQVYNWSGNLLGGAAPQGAVGSALFTSTPINFVGNGSFEAITVTTGGTTLIAGNPSVALFTISGPDATDYLNSTGTASWGDTQQVHVSNDGGGFNFYNNGSNFAAINNGNWNDFADFGDLAWKANFTASAAPVPEPSIILLLLSVVGGVGLTLRRKLSV